MEVDASTIDNLVARIKAVADPLQVIVFGSAARGLMAADSDIDVLVVVPVGTHRRKTCELLHKQMSGLGVPVDLIVATKEDLEKHKDNPGLIYRAILREGKTVYAA